MSGIFGECACGVCGSTTTWLLDLHTDEKKVYTVGEVVPPLSEKGKVVCDYCHESFDVRIIMNEGVLSAVVSEKEFTESPVVKPQPSPLVPEWVHAFSSPFRSHPMKAGKGWVIEGETYAIQHVYRREWTEEDHETRLQWPKPEGYLYEVIAPSGGTQWIVISEEGEAVVRNTFPQLTGSEEWVDITGCEEPPRLEWSTSWQENMVVSVFRYKRGVRVLVTNDKEEIQSDIFRQTEDQAFEVLEEMTEWSL